MSRVTKFHEIRETSGVYLDAESAPLVFQDAAMTTVLSGRVKVTKLKCSGEHTRYTLRPIGPKARGPRLILTRADAVLSGFGLKPTPLGYLFAQAAK